MPQLLLSDFPEERFRHLLQRARQRNISVSDLQQLYYWVASNPTVPVGRWYKRFPNFTICGNDQYLSTFLEIDQIAIGTEVR